jgi:hypothetical protein
MPEVPGVLVRAEGDADFDEINEVVCLAFKREDHGQLVRDNQLPGTQREIWSGTALT